jgi:hypothetical protein
MVGKKMGRSQSSEKCYNVCHIGRLVKFERKRGKLVK